MGLGEEGVCCVKPKKIKLPVSGERIVQVAGGNGDSHCSLNRGSSVFFVTRDHKVYGCGNNEQKQLCVDDRCDEREWWNENKLNSTKEIGGAQYVCSTRFSTFFVTENRELRHSLPNGLFPRDIDIEVPEFEPDSEVEIFKKKLKTNREYIDAVIKHKVC